MAETENKNKEKNKKYEFRLPDLGEGIAEAEIRKWLVKEGDPVAEHQDVLEVETDKAVVELPAPQGGKVGRLLKEEGDTAKVGDVLMTITDGAEAAAPEEEKKQAGRDNGGQGYFMPGEMPLEPPAPVEEKAERKKRESVTVMGELPESGEEEQKQTKTPLAAAPAARELARQMGISEPALRGLKGSGPGGIITKEDVLKFSSTQIYRQNGDEFGPVERVPLRGIRRAMAGKLAASQRNSLFVTVTAEADVTELWEIREREKGKNIAAGERGKEGHLTFLPFFIKAAQHALKEHAALNASVQGPEGAEELVLKKYISMAIAVDTPEGLMAPVIKDVDKKTILELAAELEELSTMARERKIGLERLRGNSFTITNFGRYGGLFATPIINPPDVAILGTGRITLKPWVVSSGRIEARRILPLSLTFDHRAADGAEASEFLAKIAGFLEDPALMLVESA